MIDSKVRRAPRLALMLALPLALASHPREALASGWPHHAQAGVVMYAPAVTPVQYAPLQYAPATQLQYAPAAQVQLAPLQYAPAAQVQLAPLQYAPAAQVQLAPLQYAPAAQVQLAPLQYAPLQYAQAQNAPVQNAPVADAEAMAAPTDNEILLLAQGLVRGGGSVEKLRSKIRTDVQGLLKNPLLRKSGELIVPIVVDLAKQYLRGQGFGFVIDESIEGTLKKFAKQAIAEIGGAGTPTPTKTADDATPPPPTSGGVFVISGRITLQPAGGGGGAVVQPNGNHDPDGGHEETPDASGGFTLPTPSELAPDE